MAGLALWSSQDYVGKYMKYFFDIYEGIVLVMIQFFFYITKRSLLSIFHCLSIRYHLLGKFHSSDFYWLLLCSRSLWPQLPQYEQHRRDTYFVFFQDWPRIPRCLKKLSTFRYLSSVIFFDVPVVIAIGILRIWPLEYQSDIVL